MPACEKHQHAFVKICSFCVKEDISSQVASIRVCKQNVKLAARAMALGDIVQMYIDEIPIGLSRRGKPGRAGRAGFFHGLGEGDVGRIVINTGVCYNAERFEDILYHELAHAVNHWVNGSGCDTHGPQWKRVMELLGRPPERCHNYTDRR